MSSDADGPRLDVEFVRLYFASPDEETTAVRIARVFASFVGERIRELQADTTISQILGWASRFSAVGFVLALEESFGHEIEDEVAVGFEAMSFRELVEYASL